MPGSLQWIATWGDLERMRKLALVGSLVAGAVAVTIAGGPAAQATVNYFDTTRTVTGTGTVACPAGYRVTGGGFELPATFEHLDPAYDYAYTYRATFQPGRMSHPTTNGWTAEGLRRLDRAEMAEPNPAHDPAVHGEWMLGSWQPYKPKVYAICTK